MKTVTITAPLCAPSRQAITGTVREQLAPYHFRDVGIDATLVRQGRTPLWWLLRVSFSDAAAEWGEYVLLRYGYHRQGRCLNPKNEAYAAKYLGMPPDGARWGATCKEKPPRIPGEMPQANPPPPGHYQERRGSSRQGAIWNVIKELFS